MQSPTSSSVSCPTCQGKVAWTDKNDYRPFCSERCKLIDFGDWANGKHVIAGDAVVDGDLDEDDIQRLHED